MPLHDLATGRISLTAFTLKTALQYQPPTYTQKSSSQLAGCLFLVTIQWELNHPQNHC